MAIVKVDMVDGSKVLGEVGEDRGQAYRSLNELATDPRWRAYLEHAPKHLIREMVTNYCSMSETGRDAVRRYPPGYYLNENGGLVHLAMVQELSEFQQHGFGTIFFRTTHPATGFYMDLETLTWVGHEPPASESWWLR